MKIKIIDLLLKIANGEKVPKKIKYVDSIWEYCKNGSTLDYINDYGNCLMECVPIHKVSLNEELEIIEEPKKIEKIEKIEKPTQDKYLYSNGKELYENDMKVYDKLNELIDEINNLKEK